MTTARPLNVAGLAAPFLRLPHPGLHVIRAALLPEDIADFDQESGLA